MPKLVATRFLRYAGKPYEIDDVFEASKIDAVVLVTIGRAKYYTAPKKRRYRRSDMRAEE